MAIIDKITTILKSKTLWYRLLVTLAIIGAISYLILSDQSCQYGPLKCDSKSKVNVEVKK